MCAILDALSCHGAKVLKLFGKIAVSALACLGAFYVIVTVFLTFVVDACSYYPLVELASPDKQHSAEIALRSCEDGTFEEMDVWITRLDEEGVKNGTVLATNPASTEVSLEWRRNDVLIIRHSDALRLENTPYSIGGIQLEFRPTR